MHKEMRAREVVKLKRSRVHHLSTSVENEDLPQVVAAGEVARVEEVRMTRRRRRRSSLQTWTARRRRRKRARCKCTSGRKGGDLEKAKVAAATQSSVYIKPGLLRRGLFLPPSCPCLPRAARMDKDR